MTLPAYGAPDGYGRFGILDVDDEGRLVCHECGRSWDHLSTHIAGAHRMTAAEYRREHGLGATTRLVSLKTCERMRDAYEPYRDEHLAALEGTRNPDRANRASRGVPWAPEVQIKRAAINRARRGRDLTDDERVWLVGDGYDLQGWADRARSLLADSTVSVRSLAEASDIAAATAHQRMKRYPRPE